MWERRQKLRWCWFKTNDEIKQTKHIEQEKNKTNNVLTLASVLHTSQNERCRCVTAIQLKYINIHKKKLEQHEVGGASGKRGWAKRLIDRQEGEQRGKYSSVRVTGV